MSLSKICFLLVLLTMMVNDMTASVLRASELDVKNNSFWEMFKSWIGLSKKEEVKEEVDPFFKNFSLSFLQMSLVQNENTPYFKSLLNKWIKEDEEQEEANENEKNYEMKRQQNMRKLNSYIVHPRSFNNLPVIRGGG